MATAAAKVVELIEAVYLGECYTYETRLVRAHGASGVSADKPPETPGAPQNV